jgi:hypothetical protein
MSILDMMTGAAKAHPMETFRLVSKLASNIKEITTLAEKMGVSEKDISFLFRPAGTPEPVEPKSDNSTPIALPVRGFLRDHEGKDYSMDEIIRQVDAGRAHLSQQAQTQAPSNAVPLPFPTPERALSCLGCRDALPGSDQPGFGKACGDKNCKGNPVRPNYSKL